jgi:hypothetical protein
VCFWAAVRRPSCRDEFNQGTIGPVKSFCFRWHEGHACDVEIVDYH